jgi:hypothetical protein
MPERPKVVAVFGSSQTRPGDGEYESGRWLGRRLVELGFAVATGGYAGTMEAVSEGAAGAGGHVIGVTAPPLFPYRPAANLHVVEEIPCATLGQRMQTLLDMSVASIALPGSIGTAAELLVAWNQNYIAGLAGSTPRLQIVVGTTWRTLVELLGSEAASDTRLVVCCPSVQEAIDHLGGELAKSNLS